MYGSPHLIYLADDRAAIKAAIKRASKAGRARLRTLDADSRRQLTDIYQAAMADLRAYLFARAGDDNTLRLTAMRSLVDQAQARLDQLADAREAALGQGMRQAAGIGAQPFAAAGVAVERIADEALRFAVNFTAADGLQLSSRIWNVDQHGREVVTQAIQRHIIQGHSASQAAQEFLQRGEAIPANVQQGIRMADANRLSRVLGQELMTGQGSPYSNALRLFRTEINRAHGEAYQAAAFQDEDVIGTRFLLSPRHPEVDICDMHARVNRYGLGPGVYPRGKNPWPAHPNTLSFVEAVYADEISTEDRAGKEDRISWLKKQDPEYQAAVLNSRAKQAALRQGVLKEGHINTPWRILKQRYARNGIGITGATSDSVPTIKLVPEAPKATEDGVIIKTAVPANFPEGATLKEAGNITRKMVKRPQAVDYQKNANSGRYEIRFRHGPRFLPDNIRKKKYNNASVSGLEVQTVNEINRMLSRMDQVADKLGIPRVRGVNTAAGKAAASMGDGVLAVSKYNNRHFKPGMNQAQAIEHYKGLVKRKQDTFDWYKENYGEGRAGELLGKDIDNLKAKLQQLEDGVPVDLVTNPPSDWTPADIKTKQRPGYADAYFPRQVDKFRQTMWHEFGHHIHQQLGVNTPAAYQHPPLERVIAGIRSARGLKLVSPSKYAMTNSREWFAESYSLYRMGRSDLLDPDLLDLIQQVERGDWKP